MTALEILEIMKYGEHIHLECKKAEATLPNSVWETYSSFANTDGGVILFGVEEHLRETTFDRRFSFVTILVPENDCFTIAFSCYVICRIQSNWLRK